MSCIDDLAGNARGSNNVGMDTASPLTLSAARSASVTTSSAGDASPVGVLRGVNGNSRLARRFREIVGALRDDCGGPAKVSETTRIVIKQAATLALRIEALQTQVLTGEPSTTRSLC